MEKLTGHLMWKVVGDFKDELLKNTCTSKTISSAQKFKSNGIIVKIVVTDPEAILSDQSRIIHKENKIQKESENKMNDALQKRNCIIDNFPKLGENWGNCTYKAAIKPCSKCHDCED
jgi:hypothetical protein